MSNVLVSIWPCTMLIINNERSHSIVWLVWWDILNFKCSSILKTENSSAHTFITFTIMDGNKSLKAKRLFCEKKRVKYFQKIIKCTRITIMIWITYNNTQSSPWTVVRNLLGILLDSLELNKTVYWNFYLQQYNQKP